MRCIVRMACRWGLLLWLAAATSLVAAQTEGRDEHVRYNLIETRYVLKPDATYVHHHKWVAKALTQQGVEGLRQAGLSHSTSVEKLLRLDAATLKAGGKRIAVRKDSYQITTQTGASQGKPAFSDRTSVAVIFPDLAVGDSVEMSYSVELREPVFPGHFSVSHEFPRETATDLVKVVIDWPSAMKVRLSHRDMKMERSDKAGRSVITWSHSQPKAAEEKPAAAYAVYRPEDHPGMVFTTFASHDEISQAYGARATPKAKPTEAVHKLVAEVTAGKSGERDKTAALYEWVAQNIAYAGNCVGVGVVVPRDLDFVLSNRMGDCKDHATLLQAMLAAAGIDSNQVLVNASQMYHLPELPVASQVNHVFTYVPSLDLFLDSTSETTPFGYLPFGDQDKPVLHVGVSRPQRTRAPSTPVGKNVQKVSMHMRVDEGGNASGEMQVNLEGELAASVRARFKDWPETARKKYVGETLKAMRLKGDGSIEFEKPVGLSDKFSYRIRFQAQQLLDLAGGTLLTHAPFWTPAPVGRFLHSLDVKEKGFDGVCHHARTEEEVRIELPKDWKLLSVPKEVRHQSAYLDYQQSHELVGQTLTVKRHLNDKSPQGLCKAEVMDAFAEASDKVLRLQKQPVLYQVTGQ